MGEGRDCADRTLWCGNLSSDTTDELLYELFLQAGPVEKIFIPKDSSGNQKRFAFIQFVHTDSVPYAIELLNGIQLFGRGLQLKARTGSAHENPPMHRSNSAPDVPVQQLRVQADYDPREDRRVHGGGHPVHNRLGRQHQPQQRGRRDSGRQGMTPKLSPQEQALYNQQSSPMFRTPQHNHQRGRRHQGYGYQGW